MNTYIATQANVEASDTFSNRVLGRRAICGRGSSKTAKLVKTLDPSMIMDHMN